MATNFPTTLDAYSTKNAGDTISESHVNDVQDAVEALEAKLGIDSSAAATSHDYKFVHLRPANVAADPASPLVAELWYRTDL